MADHSIMDNGGINDGTGDNYTALRTTAALCSAGDRVTFPAGTYQFGFHGADVDDDNNDRVPAFALLPNISYVGLGADTTGDTTTRNRPAVIKLANFASVGAVTQQEWTYFAGSEAFAADLSGTKILNLKFDMNSANNALNTSRTFLHRNFRWIVFIYKGTGPTIDNCEFVNHDGNGCICMDPSSFITKQNTTSPLTGGKMTNNYIHSFGNTLRIHHDSSAIFGYIPSGEIGNNVIKGVTNGYGCSAGMECGGASVNVHDNQVFSFMWGWHTVGNGSTLGLSQSYKNNYATGIIIGTWIWPFEDNDATLYPQSKTLIQGNTFEIDLLAWANSRNFGAGLTLITGGNLPTSLYPGAVDVLVQSVDLGATNFPGGTQDGGTIDQMQIINNTVKMLTNHDSFNSPVGVRFIRNPAGVNRCKMTNFTIKHLGLAGIARPIVMGKGCDFNGTIGHDIPVYLVDDASSAGGATNDFPSQKVLQYLEDGQINTAPQMIITT